MADHFGKAGYRRQRRFEFMGDIGGKLPADGFGLLAFRNVQNHDDRTHGGPPFVDRVGENMLITGIRLKDHIGGGARQGLVHCVGEFPVPGNIPDALSLKSHLRRLQQADGAAVDGKHITSQVDEDQAFLHVFGDDADGVPFSLEALHLGADQFVLSADTDQEGQQFLIKITLGGIINMVGQPVDGLKDTPGDPSRQRDAH